MRLSVSSAARDAGDSIAIIDGPRKHTWRDIANAVRAQTMPSRAPRELAPTLETTSVVSIYSALSDRLALVLRHPRRRPQRRAPLGSIPKGCIALESSGTTAEPKLIIHRREALIAHADASAKALGSEPDDRWLVCLPLAHVSGLAPLVRALVHRRAVILEPRFSPQTVIKSVETHRATLLSLVPTMLDAIVSTSWRPPSHLRHVLVGGARCPAPLLQRARDLGMPIRIAYGMTETFSHVALDGGPLDGVELRVDDHGVLWVRAAMATSWPDWLRTGDRATIDDSGRISILGRADEMIISGGENVSPLAVERALTEHPEIREAAVVGLADDRWGQIVAAVIVASPALDTEAVHNEMSHRLASFEHPRRYVVVEELPRSASGKVDRAALLKLFE